MFIAEGVRGLLEELFIIDFWLGEEKSGYMDDLGKAPVT